MLHQKIIEERQEVPEENLNALYDIIHTFRLGLKNNNLEPRKPGLLVRKLNGAFFEPLPKDELQLWE